VRGHGVEVGPGLGSHPGAQPGAREAVDEVVVGDEVRVNAVDLHPAEHDKDAGRVGGGDVGLHEGIVEVGVGLDAVVREDGEELQDLARVPAPVDGVGEGEEGPAWGSRWRWVELVEEVARDGDGAVDCRGGAPGSGSGVGLSGRL
jgi:hypothetical protein